METPKILCGANYYEQKFYLNEYYRNLPESVRQELQIMCVLFVNEVRGIILLEFDDYGNLLIHVTSREGDIYFDEAGSELKVAQLRREKRELFEQLEEYYNAACR